MKHLIHLLTSIKPILNNAFSAIYTEVKKKTEMPGPSPPENFKCCKLLKIDSDSIQLEWPTGQLVLWKTDAQ